MPRTEPSAPPRGTISIKELFSINRFLIAGYQRQYDWGNQQVTDLAEDLLEHSKKNSATTNSTNSQCYLLNSMLTVDRGDRLEVIDGQQRLTTLMILFAAIEESCAHLLPSPWKSTLRTWVGKPNGGIYDNLIEIEHCSSDTRQFLRALANQEEIPLPNRLSPAFALQRAYATLKDWVMKRFLDDEPLLLAFLDALASTVYVAEVRLNASATAWLAFEKSNNRGKPLSVADLVKSHLFNQAKTDRERDQVADNWRKLLEKINGNGEPIKVETFLHHIALSDLADKKISKTEILKTFDLKNIAELPDRKAVTQGSDFAVEFSQYLLRAAEVYIHICSGRAPNGRRCVPLEDLYNVPRFRKALRQYRQVLMAARDLDASEFDSVVLQIERLVVCLTLIGEYGTAAQEIFSLTKCIRDSWGSADDSSGSASDRLRDKVSGFFTDERKARLSYKLQQANKDDLGRDVVRYLLTRLENYAETGRSERDRKPAKEVFRGMDIEHILPQKPDQLALYEFEAGDTQDALRLINNLGNLTIWEAESNRAYGNKPYSEKRKSYQGSTSILTRRLVQVQRRSKKSDKLSDEIGLYESWNEQALCDRQRRMARILYTQIVNQELPEHASKHTTTDYEIYVDSVPRVPSPKNLAPALEAINDGASTVSAVASELKHATDRPAKDSVRLLAELDLIQDEDPDYLQLTETGLLICSAPRECWESEIKRLVDSRSDWKRVLELEESAGEDTPNGCKRLRKLLEWASAPTSEPSQEEVEEIPTEPSSEEPTSSKRPQKAVKRRWQASQSLRVPPVGVKQEILTALQTLETGPLQQVAIGLAGGESYSQMVVASRTENANQARNVAEEIRVMTGELRNLGPSQRVRTRSRIRGLLSRHQWSDSTITWLTSLVEDMD